MPEFLKPRLCKSLTRIPVYERCSIDSPVNFLGRDTPVRSSTNSLQHATRKRKRRTVQVPPFVMLINSVKQRLPCILEFCRSKTSLSDILQNEQEMQFADKRVDHLKQVDGNKTPSEEQKLLKGLSQLSLARQFTAWEVKSGWQSRADTLYNKIHAAGAEEKNVAIHSKGAGKMTRFVREHGYPSSDHNVVRKGIQRGIAQLLFLKSMEEVSITPAQKEAIQGILALVTIFEHASFQSIPILELPALAKSFLKEHDSNDNMDVSLMTEQEISKWFENMTGDFEMISQTTKRGRRDQLQTMNASSHVANGSAVLDTHPQHEDRPSNNSENSNYQTNPAVYPSINSHELTTFSTLPRIESNSQRMPSYSSFIEFQARPGEVGMLPNTGSHDLAQFSRNTNDATYILTRNSNSCSESHELSLFSRAPSRVSTRPHLLVPSLCSAFPSNVPSQFSTFQTAPNVHSHELSSFSTIPA